MSGQSLRDRAHNGNGGGRPGSAVATRPTGDMSVASLIDRQKSEIARALPKHLDADRLARIALTVIRQNPDLGRCDSTSLLGALMTSAQLGLEPGPLGESYFVPFGNKVTFIPGYRGLIKLAWQSGRMKSIGAHVVYESDEFDFEYGLNPRLVHKPNLHRPEGARKIAVYAAATFKDGGDAFVVLSAADVAAIRKRSRASNSGPWVSDEDAMWRKTAVRQLARWLPMSTELSTFHQAAERDGTVRSDYTAPVAEADSTFVDGEIEGEVVDERIDDHREPAQQPHQGQQGNAGTGEMPSTRMRNKMHAALAEIGITEHDERVSYIGRVIGRDVTSSSEITKDECSQVIQKAEADLAAPFSSHEPPEEDQS